jgi:hypothetical protein
MRWIGSFGNQDAPIARKYLVGDTVNAGQVICWPGLAGNGSIGDPASVNDYSEAFGVSTEKATYNTTQGSGGVLAQVQVDPMGRFLGRVSGGVTKDTAFVDGTDGNLMTAASGETAGLVLADADVGTSEFVGGYLVGLTGNNPGQIRVIDAHADNTSLSVADPFDADIASADTYLRTFGPGLQGLELTTDFTQFNGRTGAGVNLPDTGNAACIGMLVDGSRVEGAPDARKRNLIVQILNSTDPYAECEFVFTDHIANSLA